MKFLQCAVVAVMCVVFVPSSGAAGGEAGVPVVDFAGPGLGHKLLYYLPNRVLDLFDMVRFRAKAGPGISAEARVTSLASFYGGMHNTVFVGLPGPRDAQAEPRPWGREQVKGILFFGVDATDDSPHPAEHSVSEVGLGVHVLVLGVDAGFDPVELGDFLAGLVGLDPNGDDL